MVMRAALRALVAVYPLAFSVRRRVVPTGREPSPPSTRVGRVVLDDLRRQQRFSRRDSVGVRDPRRALRARQGTKYARLNASPRSLVPPSRAAASPLASKQNPRRRLSRLRVALTDTGENLPADVPRGSQSGHVEDDRRVGVRLARVDIVNGRLNRVFLAQRRRMPSSWD